MISTRTDEKTGRPYARIGSRRIPMPRSRFARMATGAAFIFGGVLGFLPVLGFWMVPLGVVILAYDVPLFRRLARTGRKYGVRVLRAWRNLRGRHGGATERRSG